MYNNNLLIGAFSNIKNFRDLFLKFQAKKIKGTDVIAQYGNLFSYLRDFISDEVLTESYNYFLYETEVCLLSTKEELINSVSGRIKNIQDFFDLFSIVIRHIFNQKIFNTNFFKKLHQNSSPSDQNCSQNSSFVLINQSSNFFVNEECKFYKKKNYNQINDNIIKLEDEIIHTDFKKDDSNFIVYSKYPKNNKIKSQMIPYFPNQTLREFLDNDNTVPTTADKLVIIKEIAHGFDELHSKGFYHLNMSSSFIAINSIKDSYIFNFSHDTSVEMTKSTPVPSFYYRHPDLIDNPKNSVKIEKSDLIDQPKNPVIIENSKEEIKQNIKYDLYSFGVLVHEIITTKSPIERLCKLESREDKCILLKTKYKDFLFSEFNDVDEFDQKYDIKGIGEIIIKCMNTNNDDDEGRYSNFKELITDIEKVISNLPLETRDEINSRIKKSIKSTEYECEISDLVINYYFDNEKTKSLISSFINCPKFKVNETITTQPPANYNDIISKLLYFLDFRIKNTTFILEDKFNDIIQNEFHKTINQNDLNLTQNQLNLISLSIFLNLQNDLIEYKKEYNYNISNFTDYILPITTLEKFIKFDQNEANIPIFAYLIGKDISIIHSNNMYHGELSLNSIGIYYDSVIQMFVPSIIPFYFLFKNTQNKPYLDKKSDDIEKLQKIIKEIDKTGKISEMIDAFIPINDNLSEINKICNQICPEIIEKLNKNNYSSLQLTYSTIHTIFTSFNKSSNVHKIMSYFLLNEESGGFLKFEQMIDTIYELICLMSNNVCKQFKNEIDQAEKIKKKFI